jgi:CBS domain-containing protein
VFVVWGILRVFTGAGVAGLWISLIGWFLIQAATGTLMQAKATALLRGITVSEAMSRDCVQVDADVNVQSFVDVQLRGPQQHCFLVMEHEHLAGLVGIADLRKLKREQWALFKVRDVMRPLGKLQTVTPETPVLDALERMGREDTNELPVVSGGYFHGVVSRARILQLLRLRSELQAA